MNEKKNKSSSEKTDLFTETNPTNRFGWLGEPLKGLQNFNPYFHSLNPQRKPCAFIKFKQLKVLFGEC